jgi:hypothetical protein
MLNVRLSDYHYTQKFANNLSNVCLSNECDILRRFRARKSPQTEIHRANMPIWQTWHASNCCDLETSIDQYILHTVSIICVINYELTTWHPLIEEHCGDAAENLIYLCPETIIRENNGSNLQANLSRTFGANVDKYAFNDDKLKISRFHSV